MPNLCISTSSRYRYQLSPGFDRWRLASELHEVIESKIREAISMKIRIDKAACVGNARCTTVSEELYPLDDDGYITVDVVDVPKGLETLAQRGARLCPERVIAIIEDDEEESHDH